MLLVTMMLLAKSASCQYTSGVICTNYELLRSYSCHLQSVQNSSVEVHVIHAMPHESLLSHGVSCTHRDAPVSYVWEVDQARAVCGNAADQGEV